MRTQNDVDAQEVISNGRLFKDYWDEYIGVEDKVFIGLTSIYLYKGKKFIIDFEYQNKTKDEYDLVPENIEEVR